MADDDVKDLVRRIEALEARREMDVERINILEEDGMVRMVLSNSSRAPDPICNDETFKRDGGNSAGLIFYNDEDDECGAWSSAADRSTEGTWIAGSTT